MLWHRVRSPAWPFRWALLPQRPDWPPRRAPSGGGGCGNAKAASLAAINNKLLITGYEETEMPDTDEPAPALSSTQYGELR